MIAELKPYPEMKDSGVSWLGQVPANWDVRRLKSLLSQPVTDGPHLTPQFLESGVPFLSVDSIQQGELVFRKCRYISAEDHAEFSKKAAPQHDDILLGKAASTGKIARVKVDFPFSIWSPLALIRVSLRETNPAFLEYALKDVAAQAQLETFCTLNTQKNISMDDIPKLMLLLPSLPEQTAIVRFLDYVDRRIRRYIRAKQKLIALLEEQKQAIVHQAVTGQVDVRTGQHYPAYKPSRVEWLGDVPAHWEVRKLGQITRVFNGATPSRAQPAYWENGTIPWLNSSKVNEQVVVEPSELVTERAVQECSISRVPSGAVILGLVGQGRTRGMSALLGIEATISQNLAALVPSTVVDGKFLHYLLAALYRYVREMGRGGNQEALNCDLVSRLRLPIPPLADQIELLRCIDDTISRLAKSTKKVSQEADLLREYRIRLIADVVTGKLDVREAAAALPEVDPLAEDDLDDPLGTTAKSSPDEFDATLEEAKS